MKLFALSIFCFLCLLAVGVGLRLRSQDKGPAPSPIHSPAHSNIGRYRKLWLKAAEAKTFVERNNCSKELCFLVDMSLASGQKRFFVYDLQKDSIRTSGLVSHGSCNQDWLEGRKYSNVPGCGCTSLGRYKTGYSYRGRFGLAFKLYGLDKTNDKAFARFVVLHAHDCVPEEEVPDEICQSNGCPMVAPGFLKELEPLIRSSSKPVLLWIYQ
jgi:hypothetical protein